MNIDINDVFDYLKNNFADDFLSNGKDIVKQILEYIAPVKDLIASLPLPLFLLLIVAVFFTGVLMFKAVRFSGRIAYRIQTIKMYVFMSVLVIGLLFAYLKFNNFI